MIGLNVLTSTLLSLQNYQMALIQAKSQERGSCQHWTTLQQVRQRNILLLHFYIFLSTILMERLRRFISFNCSIDLAENSSVSPWGYEPQFRRIGVQLTRQNVTKLREFVEQSIEREKRWTKFAAKIYAINYNTTYIIRVRRTKCHKLPNLINKTSLEVVA